MPSEPTRHQLSSRLAYNSGSTPKFLQAFKARMEGNDPSPPPEEQYDEPEEEWEDPGDGRPPIPRRPAIPERPREGEWGTERVGKEGERERAYEEDEERGEEAPVIVVLKEGKHLTAEDVENEKRAAKGLPPLQKKSVEPKSDAPATESKPTKPSKEKSLSFSSQSKKQGAHKKRKVIGGDDEDEEKPEKPIQANKKPKKEKKSLLSFADDA